MAKTYKFTPAEVPPRCHGKGIYDEIVADFIAQSTETVQVTIEGMKESTLRAGLRTAIKGRGEQDVKVMQRGETTYLVRQAASC